MSILALTRWSRYRFLAGANRTIPQESTFWRRSLWERAGRRVDASRRWAADFEPWLRFFRHAQIYPVDALIAGFRLHRDSLALSNMQVFNQIGDEIVDAELSGLPDYKMVKLLKRIDRTIRRVPKLRGIWQRALVNNLRHGLCRMPGPDWPPVIEYKDDRWIFRR